MRVTFVVMVVFIQNCVPEESGIFDFDIGELDGF